MFGGRFVPKLGPHPINKLSAAFVKTCTTPGRYADGQGLYLLVGPGSSRRWILRMVIEGKRRDITIGSARDISLKQARAENLQLRLALKRGEPVPLRTSATPQSTLTFRQAAEQVHEDRLETFRNKKHAAQWIQTLNTYAFPHFGTKALTAIEPSDVVSALRPIWISKPETARRVKQRITVVFDWAKALGHCKGDNPAATVSSILPRQPKTQKHFDAMPYADVPGFVAKLLTTGASEPTRLGIILIILTALRTNEARLAHWEEVNFKGTVWTIPPTRQLKKRQPSPHTVPLSPQAVAILKRLKKVQPKTSLMFPSADLKNPISDMTFLAVLRRLELPHTVHGFRSSFRDWASEETNHRDAVVEKSLAHEIPNKVEAAYRRGDLLQKRRLLMQDWSDFVIPADTLGLS